MIRSTGATIIQQIFENRGVRYQTEITIPNGGRFDFGVFKSNSGIEKLVCLIEFDGSQHENEDSWLGSKKLTEMDKLKDKWAEENNIPLIRISESEFASIISLSQFVEDKLLPALPEEAFLNLRKNKPDSIWSGIRNRSISVSELTQEFYSIKDVANLMNYSESYISSRIKNNEWFVNHFGTSNFETIPYKISREDLILGISRLGFLKDFNGNKLNQVDESMVIEIVEKLKNRNRKKSKSILVIMWSNNQLPQELDVSDFDKVLFLNNPQFREAVLLAMNDSVESILFVGCPPEEIKELIYDSIIQEKLLEVK